MDKKEFEELQTFLNQCDQKIAEVKTNNDETSITVDKSVENIDVQLGDISSRLQESLINRNNKYAKRFLDLYSNVRSSGFHFLEKREKLIGLYANYHKEEKRFKELKQEKQEFLLSSWIFNKIDNFFISPKFWNVASKDLKTELLNNINSERNNFPEVSDFISTINIFDKKYKI